MVCEKMTSEKSEVGWLFLIFDRAALSVKGACVVVVVAEAAHSIGVGTAAADVGIQILGAVGIAETHPAVSSHVEYAVVLGALHRLPADFHAGGGAFQLCDLRSGNAVVFACPAACDIAAD